MYIYIYIYYLYLYIFIYSFISFVYFRGYEVAYRKKGPGPRPESAKKNTTNTHIVLKNLTAYEEYLVQVRAFTIEPGPWTKRKSFLTPMEGI